MEGTPYLKKWVPGGPVKVVKIAIKVGLKIHFLELVQHFITCAYIFQAMVRGIILEKKDI